MFQHLPLVNTVYKKYMFLNPHTYLYTQFFLPCFHGAPIEVNQHFVMNARVPGINRQMLPSTCPFTLLLNRALAQPHR